MRNFETSFVLSPLHEKLPLNLPKNIPPFRSSDGIIAASNKRMKVFFSFNRRKTVLKTTLFSLSDTPLYY